MQRLRTGKGNGDKEEKNRIPGYKVKKIRDNLRR